MIDGRQVEVEVGGSLVTNSIPLIQRAVMEGVAIAMGIESAANRMLRRGLAVMLLEEYSRPASGWHIYYPSRHQMPVPLRVFVDFMKAHPAVLEELPHLDRRIEDRRESP